MILEVEEPTGRPAKSTTSVSEKLRRESIRLTQIQDIAGCRLTVADIVAQDSVVEKLKQLFEHATVVDRRQHPSHGYRAVHVIVTSGGKLVEIQVRTSLQHLWAELSEKFSDVWDPSIKYGRGDVVIRSLLEKTSALVAKAEQGEKRLAVLAKARSGAGGPGKVKEEIVEAQEDLNLQKQQIAKLLQDAADIVRKQKGENRAVSN